MADQRVVHTLSELYRIAEAGEKGYATAAVNMPNLGIKVFFKSLAQQRARFKVEILEAIHSANHDLQPRSSIPGVIHRGRVAIFAAMTIEEDRKERVILKEVALGESVAVRAYERALTRELPVAAKEIVTRQLVEIRKAWETVKLMIGQAGKRMVVNLFPSEDAAEQAVHSLKDAGFLTVDAQKVSLNDTELYRGKGATVSETIFSGAFGGALWGGLTGILVGFGVMQTVTPAPTGFLPILLTFLLVALGFVLIGAFISSVLAFFIGVGIAEDDSYQLKESLDRHRILLQTVVDQAQAGEINQKMNLEFPKSS